MAYQSKKGVLNQNVAVTYNSSLKSDKAKGEKVYKYVSMHNYQIPGPNDQSVTYMEDGSLPYFLLPKDAVDWEEK